MNPRSSLMPNRSSSLPWTVGVIAAVAVIWLLRSAAVVAMPLAAAFFVAIAIYPVQVWLSGRLPRHQWAAPLLTMALLVLLLGGLIWGIAEAVDEAVERTPSYSDRLQHSWSQLVTSAHGYGVPLPQDLTGSTDVRQRLASFGTAVARTVWEIVSGLVLVLFLVILMLLEGATWRRNARRTFALWGRGGQPGQIVDEIAGKVRTYLWVRTVLGVMSAVAASVWLLVMGVDLVLVWALLTLALNYIPNLGSIIAVMPPSLMALVQHGPVRGLITLAGLAVIEQVIGNYIDPRMQGRRLQVSPVVVLSGLVFWTWMWGVTGALLAVPMTVTLLAAAAHSERLRPLSTLLGDADDDSDPSRDLREP